MQNKCKNQTVNYQTLLKAKQ